MQPHLTLPTALKPAALKPAALRLVVEPVGGLDRPRLAYAFETACLVRSTSLTPLRAAGEGNRHPVLGTRIVEFNQEPAARRMWQLMRRLDIPCGHEVAVAGLRRRYQLHRLYVPRSHQQAYDDLMALAWRQGRDALLSPIAAGASAPRHLWRPRLAGAAWRAVLLAAGRHMRKHMLGVRVTDQDYAALLVRGAQVLGATATLARHPGCFLIVVPGGSAAGLVLRGAGAASAVTASA